MRKIDPAILGKWVKAHRKARKMTQEELATAAGITRYQLIRIENGESKTTRETASALAVALEQNEGEALRLAGYDGEPAPPVSMALAQQIEAYLSQIQPDRRQQAERYLLNQAQVISEILAA